MGHSMSHNIKQQISIEDCAKDGGKEFFTKMHCVRITNL